jgi:hypothetical protein
LTGVDAEGNPVTASFDATATLDVEKDAGSRSTSSAEETGPAAAPKPARARRVKPLAEPEPDALEPPF